MTEAIILAGGLGTRLRTVVTDVPKPMAPIKNRPFLEYLLDYWVIQGVTRFILSIGYKHEIIQAHFGNRYKTADILYSIEEQPLGTGGGLLQAIDKIKSDNYLVINGDTFFAVDLINFSQFHANNNADFSIALFTVEQNSRYMGIHLNNQQKISELNVRPENSKLINGGVYLIKKNLLAKSNDLQLPLSLEQHLLPNLFENGKNLFGFVTNKPFIDIGIPEDYLRAPFIIAKE